MLLSAIISPLLQLGIAQVIDYVGRTARASEEAAENAQASADLLRQLIRAYGRELDGEAQGDDNVPTGA